MKILCTKQQIPSEKNESPIIKLCNGNRCYLPFENYKRTPRIIDQRGKQLGEFSRPLGLAYDDITEKFYVCDEGNNRVTIFNHDFSTKELLHSKIGFNGPYDILICKNNRIIISEHRAHRLQII